ncbi:unnamed protein product [Protopolystoma xenopodis]|uniref:Uncharacterized protein n=1 Tax=Protopolystoma xenopodis TaxID=117903 RepID=A0A448WPY5_9PLAT|nr:unnamed protein product [Protopolystoma xenopodis]
MVSCSDDAHHMTDEGSARIHRGRKAVRRGLFVQIYNHSFKATPLQPPMKKTYKSLPLASSNEMKGTPTSNMF